MTCAPSLSNRTPFDLSYRRRLLERGACLAEIDALVGRGADEE